MAMKPTVLFVDDQRFVTEAMKRALRGEPYDVVVAASGREALEILERQPVDVMVVDERMPGMAGSELLRQAHLRFPDTVRIVLTGHATLEQAIGAINDAEVHRFLTKPCSDAELIATLRDTLNQKLLQQDAKHMLELLKTEMDWGATLVPTDSDQPAPPPPQKEEP
jgi:DNA-binding NtrC family response regulator